MTHYCVLVLQWYHVEICFGMEETVENKESLLTPDEAATLLNVSKVSVLRLVKAGKLPASRLGRRTIRIRPDAVSQLIEEAAHA